MTFTPEQIKALQAPLDPKHVASRSQGGGKVSYIEGWHAIAEANRIFGFDNWTRETVDLRQLGEPYEVNGKWRVNYSAKVRVTVGCENFTNPIIREGCGFGQGIDKDVGQAHESALKEAETDAMKRALMTFGNPFGLALYDKSRANVQAPPPEKVPTISEDQQTFLINLCNETGVNLGDFLLAGKCRDLRDVPASQFENAKAWINDRAKEKENA